MWQEHTAETQRLASDPEAGRGRSEGPLPLEGVSRLVGDPTFHRSASLAVSEETIARSGRAPDRISMTRTGAPRPNSTRPG